ncbi:hypothetical protein HQ585_09850 [candidate division KSB1 bacterium]|nr:hypothetical protein [candidate division KSB1 bacterium]
MYYLIIQLFKTEYKEDLLLALTSCGIEKGSLFEGQNLDKLLQRDYPLFTGFVRSEDERERFSALVTAVVDRKERVDELIALLKEADIDIRKEEILRIVLLPAHRILDHEIDWEGEA